MPSSKPPQWKVLALLLLATQSLWACKNIRSSPEEFTPDPGGTPESGASATSPSPERPSPVLPGARVLLEDSLHLVRGRRVGLLTNHTGIVPPAREMPSSAGGAGGEQSRPEAPRATADLLREHPEVELVALFGPEHGIRGAAEAGEEVESGVDPVTGLPVHSLYGASRRPAPETLEGLEVLVFDIQDVGARYYTYVWTMALAMEAAGRADLSFVVLDRVDPLGGLRVQGNVLDTAFASFVGLHPVAMRHGMTPGELARLLVGEFGVAVELHVVPVRGWRRALWFDETGLPWVAPSPNMPSLESAAHYPGTCLFEGTNLSVGRGTPRPFQWIGAPWLDGGRLAERLNARDLPGVRFEAARFTPESPGDGKFPGVEVEGIRFVLADRDAYDPTVAAVAALVEARRLSGDRWSWRQEH
ncbi:MAG: DUF1343 domain-containing protein, partial [Gemmatimonadetes bacterium]|nr:DUF1343 domain-containing protein [Gemmatimonadota bacterium]NIR80967.1 DUF1343 domain-containing protein [Gemmatimonadota bacterium]NIT89788.1 DUF1343 domain-containing protein [Gemmatimonadota bacterium]NIU33574.1 DUF1343 domain-containing protein [Gemmatimonadota bacterium]NIU37840.1 DUF1343 domain-containing protein [Gemmatimonadota bacterium]